VTALGGFALVRQRLCSDRSRNPCRPSAAAWPEEADRAAVLARLVPAILTTGRRTVANLLRTVAGLTEGDPSSSHCVPSLARWSGLSLAALLARVVLRHFWPTGRSPRRHNHVRGKRGITTRHSLLATRRTRWKQQFS
jgi:hypothetical protein